MTRPMRRGAPWGQPSTGEPDVDVSGGDRELARVARHRPGTLVRLRPSADCDLARALGLQSAASGSTAVSIDAISLDAEPHLAVNAVVLGCPPDRLRWVTPTRSISVLLDGRAWFSGRATTVVVASGQYLRGVDLVPRGHPGDGRIEVQVYAMRRSQRRTMRRRLPQGAHVPHPGIRERAARSVEIRVERGALPLEVDGQAAGRASSVLLATIPGSIRVLV